MSQQDPYTPQPTYTPAEYPEQPSFPAPVAAQQAWDAQPAAMTPAPAAQPGYSYPSQGYPSQGYPSQGYPSGQAYAAAGYQVPPAPGTDSFAIVALVLGLLGVSLGGVIFGHLSLKRIAESGAGGRGLAIAGLVLGYLGMAFGVLYVIFMVSLGASGQLG